MYAPMEAGHVSGSELQEEDWKHVDEGRRGSMRYNCGMMGHVGKGKVKGGEGGKEHAKGKRGNDERHGKERYSQVLEDPREDVQGNRKVGPEDSRRVCGTAGRTSWYDVDEDGQV